MNRFILALALFFFVSCQSEELQETIVTHQIINGTEGLVVRKYLKGEILNEQILTLDSVKNGAYREWNHGKLYCSGSFLDGKKNGQWIFF